MKRILFIIPSFSNGGTVSSLKNLIPFLGGYGISPYVFAITSTSTGPNRKFFEMYSKVISFGNRTSSKKNSRIVYLEAAIKRLKKILERIGIDISPIVFRQVARRLDAQKFDIVVAFQEGQATRLASYLNASYTIAWIHCDYKEYLRTSKASPESYIYNKFNKIVCVSEYTKKQFSECIPNLKSVYSVHNILRNDEIRRLAKKTIENLSFLSKTKDVFTILSIGRLESVKRFKLIPQIVSNLLQSNVPQFVWFIIGEGHEREKIESEIAKYNLSNVFLLGEINNPYPYLAQSNLLVSTSLSEACPYVINEAKILHTPIVSSDFGSVYEFIENRKNGLISPIDKVSESIKEIMTNRSLYLRIKEELGSFSYDNEAILSTLVNEVFHIEH